ncbi:bHLH/Zip transcription factor [Zygosaccharomyces mellis]|uniref:BHLH/Zip transcription factor n=1 Tax=Zygosaccharomyces mellis TaxID=42258 RepID=A0A4C2EG00_9SACH|nr:bHLH/Zip transcription factor [Zygosaccharomyces mellis]
MMVAPRDEGWEEQQTWESLLNEHMYGGLDFPPQQPYDGNTPAQQHENLPYDIDHDKMEFNQNTSRSGSQLDDQYSLSEEATPLGTLPTGISTMTMSGQNWRDSPADEFRRESIPQQQQQRQQQPLEEPQTQQPPLSEFFTRTDDASLSFADDLGSSLGSSLYTEILTPSYSSSLPYQPQSFNGPASYLSPPTGVRSPSSSLRAPSYLSGSIRNTSANTPRTRHASISNSINNGSEGILPGNISNEDRLKRKREFHNAVERRRRELIKLKIKELGTIVPPSLLNYDSNGKHVKPNKSIILNKTVEYLEYLLQVLEAQEEKKVQLLKTLQELQDKSKATKMQNHKEQQQAPLVTGSTPPNSEVSDLSGKIVHTRANPSQSPLSTVPWTNNQQNLAPTNDDLQQFLSGDLIEAEDNAKLIFGDGNANPADYLLEFDS